MLLSVPTAHRNGA